MHLATRGGLHVWVVQSLVDTQGLLAVIRNKKK